MGEEQESGRTAVMQELPPVASMETILAALADPIRLSIARSLAGGELEKSCGAFDLPVTKSTLSHHFGQLREAGLIAGRYEGTKKFIRLRRADVEAVYPGLLDVILQTRRSEVSTG